MVVLNGLRIGNSNSVLDATATVPKSCFFTGNAEALQSAAVDTGTGTKEHSSAKIVRRIMAVAAGMG
jgi:hypothetical protein